jgi:hypothetical protein
MSSEISLEYDQKSSYELFKSFVASLARDPEEAAALVGDYGENWYNEANLRHWYWLHVKFRARQMYAEEGGVAHSKTGCRALERICIATYNIGRAKMLFENDEHFTMVFRLCAAIGDVREACDCFHSDDICDECMSEMIHFAPSYKQTDQRGKPQKLQKMYKRMQRALDDKGNRTNVK